MFKKVEDFNKNIIGIDRKVGPMPEDEQSWFVGAIEEEVDEFRDACINQDFPSQIDAVIDIIYFACGAMTRMGVNHTMSEDMFNAVHECNMRKIKGVKDRVVKNNNDAIKPEDWVSPEIRIIDILSKGNR